MAATPSAAHEASHSPPAVLRWPLPALLLWFGGWLAVTAMVAAGMPAAAARLVAVLAVAIAAWRLPAIGSRWRRLIAAAGYPLALVAAGSLSSPGWIWPLAFAALVLAYPLRAWHDAPWFPTPAAALHGLAARVALDPGVRILDAGCGLGDGLLALRREWPHAAFEGIEWSWPMRLAAGWRCRFARVWRGDMWAADWSPYALVYLFQRPESMARAIAKAEREMVRGAWVASLEFEVPGRRADAVLRTASAAPVWLYRVGRGAAQPSGRVADNPA